MHTERSIAYLRNYKIKEFLTIFSPESNVSFCRWFELYGLFSLDIPSCTFNQNAWICSYERLNGSNYYPSSEPNFATKKTITFFFTFPQSCLRHYERPSSKLLKWLKCFSLFSLQNVLSNKDLPCPFFLFSPSFLVVEISKPFF